MTFVKGWPQRLRRRCCSGGLFGNYVGNVAIFCLFVLPRAEQYIFSHYSYWLNLWCTIWVGFLFVCCIISCAECTACIGHALRLCVCFVRSSCISLVLSPTKKKADLVRLLMPSNERTALLTSLLLAHSFLLFFIPKKQQRTTEHNMSCNIANFPDGRRTSNARFRKIRFFRIWRHRSTHPGCEEVKGWTVDRSWWSWTVWRNQEGNEGNVGLSSRQ